MNEAFDCWKCGVSLGEIFSLPLGRNDSCPSCRAELCVCRLCHFYDPTVANQCREPIAEQVSNKERANFCGYFQLNHHAYLSNSGEQVAAKSQLDALFAEADSTSTTDEAASSGNTELDQLFK
jgi:hypothetical protein